MVQCGECKLSIGNKDKVVTCNGACNGCVFHVDCTDLKDLGAAWEKTKNVGGLKWFCVRCNDSYKSVGLDGFMYIMIKTSVDKAVGAEMVKINAKLDKIVGSQTEPNSSGSSFVQGSQRKRKRLDDDVVATPKISSTYRDNLVFGTNENAGDAFKLKGVPKPSDETPADFKSIYLSQLDPSTESKDIIEYLTDANIIDNTNAVKCIKLVSPKSNAETFTYVSFKIDAPNEIYEKLVLPATWPKSVAVRDFVHKPRPTANLTKN